METDNRETWIGSEMAADMLGMTTLEFHERVRHDVGQRFWSALGEVLYVESHIRQWAIFNGVECQDMGPADPKLSDESLAESTAGR